ncbi:hypothetical protein KJA15_01595 [Patescibacteria group bacterium]|nr:hypothetical protein [Patescibacteria group bacterium]
MRKIYIFILSTLVLGGIILLVKYYLPAKSEIELKGQCEINEMIFYYSNRCGWCNKVKTEKTIPKLRQLGVDITEIDVDVEPIKHQFGGVPTLVIVGEIYSGYRTFEQLKEMLNCKEL